MMHDYDQYYSARVIENFRYIVVHVRELQPCLRAVRDHPFKKSAFLRGKW